MSKDMNTIPFILSKDMNTIFLYNFRSDVTCANDCNTHIHAQQKTETDKAIAIGEIADLPKSHIKFIKKLPKIWMDNFYLNFR